MYSSRIACIILLACVWHTYCFYVPGVAPAEFKVNDKVEVKAVKMTSVLTHLPFEYFTLEFCKPDTVVYEPENLGEILRGDRIVNTAYNISMKVNTKCRVLCEKKLDKLQSEKFMELIGQDYKVHLVADNLPAATQSELLDGKGDYRHDDGYYLGYYYRQQHFINNHLKFTMLYHTEDNDFHRVVGFKVEPFSIDKTQLKVINQECTQVETDNIVHQKIESGDNSVYFTYEVEWKQSDIRWASRWDLYLAMSDAQIHWFSIINSVIVILFLTGIITMILVRTLRKDIAKYNREDEMDETLEESGWKLVHGDVFRPPKHPNLFVSIIGSGLQLFFMLLITIVFAMLGMLSPASRGALMTAALFLFMFMGLVAGYYAGRLYRTIRGTQWKRAAFLTATLIPGIVFSIFFVLNFFLWGKHSSGAVPFATMLALLLMWFGISLPLVFLGYYFGFRKQPYEHPVRTNQIPRQVPTQPWYMNTYASALMAGVLPFGAMFIELFFIYNAIWENKFYYMFGFLFLVFLILVVSCAQIAVVLTYFQLCSENYRWWWRALMSSAGPAVYMLGYAVFYYYSKLQLQGFIPTLLYFGYSLIMALVFGTFTSTVGFYAAYLFVRKIYSAIKID